LLTYLLTFVRHCRLPYVGADLWELTTARLQRAIIDKASHTPETEQKITVADTDSEANLSTAPPNSPTDSTTTQQHTGSELSSTDVAMYVNKCSSIQSVCSKTDYSVRCSVTKDEDEAVGDCDVEL